MTEPEQSKGEEELLVHVTTTVEHIQLILESIQAIVRLADESVLVWSRAGDLLLFPDLEGPVLINDGGGVMGDSLFEVHWHDERTTEQVFEQLCALDRFDEEAVRELGLEALHRAPTAGQMVQFCNLPPSDN